MRPTGPDVLVVLHGGGPGCHAEADFRAMPLPDRQTLLVDLPGYGRTPVRRPPAPRFSAYAETLAAVLDARGIEVCDVLAQSLGGIAALVLAARDPGRVRRIVAIGSQPLPPPAGIHVDPALGSRARAAYYSDPSPARLRETVLALEWRDPSRIPDELLAARYAASTTPDALAAAAEPSLLGEPEDLSWLPGRVPAETLVVWGEHDPFGEPAYAQWLAGRLGGTFAVVEGAAHHPQSELPEETAGLVRAHLA